MSQMYIQKYVLKILPLCEYDINLRIQFVKKLLWCKSKFTYTKYAAPTDSMIRCFFTLATVPSFYHLYYKVSSFSAMEVWCTEKGKRAIILRSSVAFLQHSPSQFCSENLSERDVNFRRSQKMPLYISHISLSQSNIYLPITCFCEIIKLRKYITKKFLLINNHIALRMSGNRWFYQTWNTVK